MSSISTIFQSRTGSMVLSGWGTSGFSKNRITCTSASDSDTNERNEFPRPSPLLAFLDNPARSTNSTVAGVSFLGSNMVTRSSKRLSGTLTIALFGSVFPLAYGLTSAPALVTTLKTVLFPLSGSPMIPHLSIMLPPSLGSVFSNKHYTCFKRKRENNRS